MGNKTMNFNLEEVVGTKDIEEEIQESRVVREESAAQSVLKKMFRSDNKSLFEVSELDDEEIGHLARLLHISERFNLKSGSNFAMWFLTLRISKNRMGRTEGFGVTKAEIEQKLKGQQPLINFFGGKMPQI